MNREQVKFTLPIFIIAQNYIYDKPIVVTRLPHILLNIIKQLRK